MADDPSTKRDVDSYIAAFSPEARRIMEEIRTLIKSTVPDAEEKISWGVPFYLYHGALAGFAAYKHHISFGTGGEDLPATESEILAGKGYKTGKKTVQIGFDQEVPAAHLKRLLKFQAEKNREKR